MCCVIILIVYNVRQVPSHMCYNQSCWQNYCFETKKLRKIITMRKKMDTKKTCVRKFPYVIIIIGKSNNIIMVKQI